MGSAPDNRSIVNSISLSGGNLDKSYGNTSKYSITTGTSLTFFSSFTASTSTMANHTIHPFFIIFSTLTPDINLGEVIIHSPWNTQFTFSFGWKVIVLWKQSTRA